MERLRARALLGIIGKNINGIDVVEVFVTVTGPIRDIKYMDWKRFRNLRVPENHPRCAYHGF